MKIGRKLYRWIASQNNNLALLGLLTFTFPETFVRSIYDVNLGRKLWGNRKMCFTLSFDCDYPEDVEALPSLLRMLSKFPFKASFACVGAWIEKYPKEHAMILEDGHEIVNHTYSHPDNELLNPGRRFRDISRDEKKEEVERCHEICTKILHYAPIGCRIPHFKTLFTEEIYSILDELGYSYSTSTWLTNTTSYGLPYQATESIIEFPVSVCPKHPFTVFDTWHSLNTERLSHRIVHRGPKKYLELFDTLINMGLETESYLNVYLDPLDIGRLSGFERILERLACQDILVETYKGYLHRQLHIETDAT
jgi:peptidoglycan/xylan/chitin deacetylase (PgdA/CDA1 family)